MDKYKKVEKMLYNYKMLEISIENMKDEIKILQENDGVTAISYDNEPCNTNKINSIVENTTLSNMEQIEYLELQIKRVQMTIDKIDRSMEGLTNTQKSIIKNKYIEGKQWYVVAYITNCSESTAKRERVKAINKLVVGIYGNN